MIELSAHIAENQTEAAHALEITEAEWRELRAQPGFPERTPQGWDIHSINAWLEAEPVTTPDNNGALHQEQPRQIEPDDYAPVEVREIVIRLPVAMPRPGTYIAVSRGRINTRLRNTELSGYRQLHAGLRESNAELANGRPVDSSGDVLRWLFEQVTTLTQA